LSPFFPIDENRHLPATVPGSHNWALAKKKAGNAHGLPEQATPVTRQVQHYPIDMLSPGLREKAFHVFIAGLFYLLVAVEGREIDNAESVLPSVHRP
jgi:hypothetical protein